MALVLTSSWLSGKNIEAGAHLGLFSIGGETALRRESGGEYGIWLGLWPTDRIALVAEWGRLPREDFIRQGPVGETDRNRQYVDFTLQFQLEEWAGLRPFLEAGGGSHWNNRNVINPTGVPDFEEAGKESTSRGVWTLGGGFRKELIPHLRWMVEVKLHNLGADQKDGLRFLTGVLFSLK